MNALKEFLALWKLWLFCFVIGNVFGFVLTSYPPEVIDRVIIRLLEIAVWAWPATLLAFFVFVMIGVHQPPISDHPEDDNR